MVPVAADQEEAAERRADRDAEVLRDAHRRVGGFLSLRRDEVGDHRLVGRAAEGAERRQQREQRQARQLVVADEQQAERDERLEAPAEEDQRPPADVVGDVPADVADAAREQRADQEGGRRARSARRAAP